MFNMEKLCNEYLKLSIAFEESNQATKELRSEYDSVRSRYHPIVWFFITLLYKEYL
jgi:hypothetical protein